MKSRLIFALCILFIAVNSPALAQGRRGVALVVGNSAYINSPLRNPVNDAQAIASVTRSAGFETVTAYDTTFSDLDRSVTLATNKIRSGDPVFIFYSGHGFQSAAVNPADGTDNFLVPVDAELTTPDAVSGQAIGFMQILRRVTARSPGPIIVVLDACRNNPFLQRWAATTRSLVRSSSGLTQPSVANNAGIYILFATAPGDTASDGVGVNGLFTSHLLRYLDQPGWSVHRVFEETALTVAKESNNDQVPWFTGSGIAARFEMKPQGASGQQQTPPLATPTQTSAQTDKNFLAGREAFLARRYDDALSSFTKAAEDGHAGAALYLGRMCAEALGTEKDLTNAAAWFAKASRGGNAEAMARLGIAYYFGYGVEANSESAYYWFLEGDKHGSVSATYGIGRYFLEGTQAMRNPQYATYYLMKASDAGYARAMLDMGQMYDKGLGVPVDKTLATRWYERAEKSGDAQVAAAAKKWADRIWNDGF